MQDPTILSAPRRAAPGDPDVAWRQEARLILPWEGAQTTRPDGRHLGRVVVAYDNGTVDATEADNLRPGEAVLDLEDPDTRAMFDHRLARRLGAPEDVVREGVMVFRSNEDVWCVVAGRPVESDGFGRWYRSFLAAGCGDDGRLFRVRAWLLAEPEASVAR